MSHRNSLIKFEELSENIRKINYPIRGRIFMRAMQLRKELENVIIIIAIFNL